MKPQLNLYLLTRTDYVYNDECYSCLIASYGDSEDAFNEAIDYLGSIRENVNVKHIGFANHHVESGLVT